MGTKLSNLLMTLHMFAIAACEINETSPSSTASENRDTDIIHGHDHNDTVFPQDPGEFLSFCLKTAFGPNQTFTFVASKPSFVIDGQNKSNPFYGGLTVQIREGLTSYSNHGRLLDIRADLEVIDFLMFNSEGNEALDFQIDHEPRNGTREVGLIQVTNPSVCKKRFLKRFSKKKRPGLNLNFTQDPIAFCKLNLELFYPAEIEYHFNIKLTGAGNLSSNDTLINKEVLKWDISNVTGYPNSLQNASINKTVEFVETKLPTGIPKLTILELDSIISHVENPVNSSNLSRKFIEVNLQKTIVH